MNSSTLCGPLRATILACFLGYSGTVAGVFLPNPVGTTPGAFSASPGGAAQYSIPIIASPGAGGIEPDLTITFASNAGITYMGPRFEVSGFSQINRCPATIAQDGFADPVNFDQFDLERFCLDGARLVSTTPSASEFRTEIESFKKVRITRNSSNGPREWEVRTKSGLILTYGGHSSTGNCAQPSASEVAGQRSHYPNGDGSPQLWLLSRVEDTTGNWMEYCYEDLDSGAGKEVVPTSIHYTGNDNAGLAPFARIEFTYRPTTGRVKQAYFFGAEQSRRQILDTLTTYVGNEVVRQYRFEYERMGVADREHFRRVLECPSSESAGIDCLQSTDFIWEAAPTGFIPSELVEGNALPTMGNYFQSAADVNADGLVDLIGIRISGSTVDARIFEAQGGEIKPKYKSRTLESSLPFADYIHGWRGIAGDYNGDGRVDVAVALLDESGNIFVRTYIATSSGGFFGAVARTYNIPLFFGVFDEPGEVAHFVGDVNGDNRADITFADEEAYVVLLSSGGGSFTLIAREMYRPNSGSGTPENNKQQLVDLNGDGLLDYAEFGFSDANGLYVRTYPNQGAAGYEVTGDYVFLHAYSGDVPTGGVSGVGENDFTMVDINGDGNADLVALSDVSANTYGHVYLGLGDGRFSTRRTTTLSSPYSRLTNTDESRLSAGDVNGDGIADLVAYRTEGGRTYSWVIHGRPDGSLEGGSWRAVDGNTAATVVQTVDMSGNGRADLAHTRFGGGYARVALVRSKDGLPSRLSSIRNGLSSSIEIEYGSLRDPTLYTAAPRCGGYPERVLCGAMQVVRSHRINDFGLVPSVREVSYTYKNFRVDLQGRGMRGPEERTMYDAATNMREEASYSQVFPFSGMKLESASKVNGRLVQLNQYQYQSTRSFDAAPDSIFPYQSRVTKSEFELNSSQQFRTTQVTTEYEEPSSAFYGNVTRSIQTVHEGNIFGPSFRTESVHEYDNDPAQWHLGRLKRTEVTRSGPDQTPQSRVSNYEYDSNTGLLSAEIIEANTGLELRTTYERDAIGNIIKSTLSGPSVDDRVTMASFSLSAPNYGRGETRTCNALGHCTVREFEGRHANPTQIIGPNGDSLTISYDPFGRKSQTIDSAGSGSERRSVTETIEREWCRNSQSACDVATSGSSYFVYTTASTGEEELVVYDQREREVARSRLNGAGDTVSIIREFSQTGEIARVSLPFVRGETIYWKNYQYDDMGRVYRKTWPCGQNGADLCDETTTYDGLHSTHRNARGFVSEQWINALGLLEKVEDVNGTTVENKYDAFENLVRTKKSSPYMSADIVSTMTYDRRGRKVAMNDADKGTWAYRYNAFGELVQQTDARGQVMTMEYDAIGRMIYRDDPGSETVWTYDDKRLGALSVVAYEPKAAWTNPTYQREYAYHTSGLVAEERVSIAGAAARTTAYEYDAYGRLKDTIFPTGFIKRNRYNAYGALDEVYSPTTSVTYWRAKGWDAWGINETQYGNLVDRLVARDVARGSVNAIFAGRSGGTDIQHLNYRWSKTGNLLERADMNQGNLRESFSHDSLERLTQVRLSGAPGTSGSVTTMSLSYDAWGNITEKSGAMYSYDGARPHAVSAVGNRSYSYDANGNVIDDGTRVYEISSFNLPTSIREGLTTVNLRYGPERQRIRKRVGIQTIDYYGGHYEEHKGLLTNVRKHHIDTPDGVAAIVDMNGFGNVTNTRYLLRDHQGSVDVVLGENGQVLQKLSFDAFGAPRPANWQGSMPLFMSYETNRGYTGHEHLYDVGLIHMNGRVYDPQLGRFLSADPFVQSPANTQSYNRYSYVVNRPLSMVDPSGFFLDEIFDLAEDAVGGAFDFLEDNWEAIAAVAITVVTAGAAAGASSAWLGASYAAAGGFAAGYVASGGDFQAGVIGALTGAAFYGVGQFFVSEAANSIYGGRLGKRIAQTVSHGIIGGARAEALGGQFRAGFLSAGATKALTPILGNASTELGLGLKGQAVSAAIVGGTASQLGGGKFSNGAVTGAFGYTFNQWLSQQRAAALQARAEQQRVQRLQSAIQRQAAEPYISYEGRQALMLSGATILGAAGTATLPVPVVSVPLRFGAGGLGAVSILDAAYSGQPFVFDAAVFALTVTPAGMFGVPVQYHRAFTAAQGVAGTAYSGYAAAGD